MSEIKKGSWSIEVEDFDAMNGKSLFEGSQDWQYVNAKEIHEGGIKHVLGGVFLKEHVDRWLKDQMTLRDFRAKRKAVHWIDPKGLKDWARHGGALKNTWFASVKGGIDESVKGKGDFLKAWEKFPEMQEIRQSSEVWTAVTKNQEHADDARGVWVEVQQSVSGSVFLKDEKGRLWSEPIILNWIEAELHDGSYDLEPWLNELMQRDDIGFLVQEKRYSNQYRWVMGPVKTQEELRGVIEDVVHHGEDGDTFEPEEKEKITLVYFPKDQSIIEKCLSVDLMNISPEWKKEKIYSMQAWLARDVLNGRAFYKKKDDLEPAKPKPFRH